MTSVVIIGAGHAAAEAISSLKKHDFAGEIVLIGDEDILPYQRPPLSKKYFTGEIGADHLFIKGPATYEAAGVIQKLGRTAVSIERDNKQVLLEDGERVDYDKLILAIGTRPRPLPVEGSDLPQIHYLRTKQDVDQIRAAIKPDSDLLIVGAGYIGLEVAASAIKQGVRVVVLEAMDRVLQRVTSPAISDFYEKIHRQAGVNIRLETALVKFETTVDGAQAVLANGETLAFDCAVVGIGVLPNSELAAEAGLPCDNGIVVDEFTRTADPDIYAIGDCCNHPSFIYNRRLRLESVPNAMGQAKTAAASICGDDIAYDEVPWFWSDQYDIKLQTVGLCQGYDQMIIRGQPADRKFAVFYLREGRLIAVDAINSPAEFMISKKLVAAGATPDTQALVDPQVSMKSFVSN